eukprot:8722693-Ditylum_brightwellii.AAC.2
MKKALPAFEKIEDVTPEQVRFVAGGHMTEPPSSVTYSSVVSYITNAYLNTPCREKIWIVVGPEFGSNAGSSSGAAWHKMIKNTMIHLGFPPCKADSDVWMKAATTLCGFKYCQCVLIYVDDVLHIAYDTKQVMDALVRLYELKEGTVGKPV